MKTLRSLVSALGVAGLLAISGAASAAPVSFNITEALFTPGSGYGIDRNEAGGTLLDVRFDTTTFGPLTFDLLPGQFRTFDFGTVGVWEPDTNGGGITANESDNLGVTAKFTFVNPLGSMQTISANGTVHMGQVGDAAIDYTILWDGVNVGFGNGGAFRIEMNTLTFSGSGANQTQSATITLLAEPQAVPIPEPATLALLGLGLLGVACTRRKAAGRPA